MPCVIDRKSIVCDVKGVVFDSWLAGDGVGGGNLLVSCQSAKSAMRAERARIWKDEARGGT